LSGAAGTYADVGLGALRAESGPLSPVARVRRLAGLERGDVAVMVVYAVAIGLVSLAVPVAAQSLVNTVAFTALLQPIVVLAALVLLGLAAAGVLRALQHRVVETLQQRFFVRAAHDVVLRLVKSEARAFDHAGAPELANRFFEVATIQKTAATLLLDGVSVVLQGIVALVLLAFYHPALLAFDAVLVTLIAVTLLGLARNGVETAVKESKAKYATVAWLEEAAVALRTLKSPGGAAFTFRRADELAAAYVKARKKHFSVLFRQIVASYALQAIGTAALLGLGGALVIRGELALGQLVAAELVVAGVLGGVAKLGKYLESFYDLAASVDKLGGVVDLASEAEDGERRAPIDAPARLDAEGVSFTYDDGAEALREVSFGLEPGGRLAVLGPDASGKSTLVELVYGLRSPTTGQLRLDGVDVRTLARGDLRRDVALVAKAEIFDGTLAENVRLDREDVDAAELTRILDAVTLSDDAAALPAGVRTRVGHGGSRLSSSQAMLVTIARALVARPRLLVLDQALDGLPGATARRVLDGLVAMAPTTSLLVVTARREIAEAVGRVVELDHGAVVASGRLS
jgi:ABC-type bacteriocin/lantibiotic exporter with double-glycine peptidase domain